MKKNFHLIFIFIPIIAIPFLFSQSNLDPALNIKFLLLSIFLISFIVYLFYILKKTVISKGMFYYFFITLFFALATLINSLYSINFSDGIFESFRYILFSVFVFLFYIFIQEKQIQFSYIAYSFLIMSSVSFCIAGYQLWDLYIKDGLSHEKMYCVFATFANKNIYAEILLVSIPFSFIFILRGNKIIKTLSLFNILISVFFITILLTRAVWIAAAASLLATLLLHLTHSYKSAIKVVPKNKNNRTYFLFGAVIFVVITFSIAFYGSRDKSGTFRKQAKDIFNFNYGSAMDRIELWKRTISLFSAETFTGNGTGSWKVLMLKYGNKNLKSENNITFYQRPHNDYLWVLAEQGIAGFALLISSFVVIIVLITRKLRRVKDFREREILYLLFFAWCCYLVFSLFSFPSERIEHIIFQATIISLLIYFTSENNEEIKINKINFLFLFAFILLLCISSFIIGLTRYWSENHLTKAFIARSNQNHQLTVDEIKKAENFLYEIDPYSTPLAWYSGSAWFQMNNIPAAHKDFLRACTINPYHIHVLNNLGTTYELLGNHDSSLYFYTNAIRISPKFEDALLNICAVKFNLKNISGAYNNLRNIDTATTNPKFKNYLSIVLKSYIDSINKTTKDTVLKRFFDSVKSNDQWLQLIHYKSIKNKISIKQQLLIDAEYVL